VTEGITTATATTTAKLVLSEKCIELDQAKHYAARVISVNAPPAHHQSKRIKKHEIIEFVAGLSRCDDRRPVQGRNSPRGQTIWRVDCAALRSAGHRSAMTLPISQFGLKAQ
jgi:hypothetical protein